MVEHDPVDPEERRRPISSLSDTYGFRGAEPDLRAAAVIGRRDVVPAGGAHAVAGRSGHRALLSGACRTAGRLTEALSCRRPAKDA